MDDLAQFRADFHEHTSQDEVRFSSIDKRLDDIHLTLKNVENLMKNIDNGTGFLRWWFDNASKVGALLALVLGLWVFFKYGSLATGSWITKHFL
jgi:hypothetical protein